MHMFAAPTICWCSRAWEIHSPYCSSRDVRVNRSRGCGHVTPPVRKTRAQIQVVRFHAEGCALNTRLQNKAIVLARCASIRASGMARIETFERPFIGNLQMLVLKHQPSVERNHCAAGVT